MLTVDETRELILPKYFLMKLITTYLTALSVMHTDKKSLQIPKIDFGSTILKPLT